MCDHVCVLCFQPVKDGELPAHEAMESVLPEYQYIFKPDKHAPPAQMIGGPPATYVPPPRASTVARLASARHIRPPPRTHLRLLIAVSPIAGVASGLVPIKVAGDFVNICGDSAPSAYRAESADVCKFDLVRAKLTSL